MTKPLLFSQVPTNQRGVNRYKPPVTPIIKPTHMTRRSVNKAKPFVQIGLLEMSLVHIFLSLMMPLPTQSKPLFLILFMPLPTQSKPLFLSLMVPLPTQLKPLFLSLLLLSLWSWLMLRRPFLLTLRHPQLI